MKGIILHGGYGSRLRPITHTGPKQLIPVANKPISQYVLEDLVKSGSKEISIVLGNVYPTHVKAYYGDGSTFDVSITYIYQGKPKGIAHAIQLCKQWVNDEPFIVYLGDNLLKEGIGEFVTAFQESNCEALILLCEVDEPQRFGVAELKEGKLIRLVEKPIKPPSKYALTGIYFFKPIIFDMIQKLKPSWRNELEITEAIQLLLENGYAVNHQFVHGWWKDTGTSDDILEANRLILDELKQDIRGRVENKGSLQGRISIGEQSTIKQGALLRGPVIIGNNTTIMGGVYIGPYTSVGNNTLLKKGEVENTIIMDECVIDVNERIIDSLIASHSTIISCGNSGPRSRRFVIGDRSHVEL